MATSDSPAGPFTYAWDASKGKFPGMQSSADLYLWYSPALNKAFMKHNAQPEAPYLNPPASNNSVTSPSHPSC